VTALRVSLVVEWDNVRLAGASRARAMLERLVEELCADDRPSVEVLLVHDGRPGDVAEARRILTPTGVDVRVVAAPGCDYYELKNAGAREARGELVVFLDCDVVPDPGWLAAIVAPFADPEVAVVAGATRLVAPVSLWAKLVAPTFVFPLTTPPGPVAPTDGFFANNVAFRRSTAVAFPFPPVAGTSRVSCVALTQRLAEANHVIMRNPSARVTHPAPHGLGNTVRRALVHGRDTAVLAEHGVGAPASARAWARRTRELVGDVIRMRRTVGLPSVALPLAIAVAVAYYACVAAGGALVRVAPGKARGLAL
jgi:hypothetical protein